MLRREIASRILTALTVMAAGIATARAQPANPKTRLSLKGYDPVAYFTAGQPTEGKPELETEFDGALYRFASAGNMSMFKGDPDRYAPQFAGSCANGMSRGMKVEANPLLWKIVDGKLYVFAGSKVPEQIETDPAPLIDKAQANWKDLRDKPYR
jgi:hypothetical protein